MKDLNKIEGLRTENRFRLDNGSDSCVVPFASLQPANIVYHGAEKFDYGHYGIHLGQEDRLTFMGDSRKAIRAFFIDCRESSPTKGVRIETTIHPTTAQTLCIPPGVAHSFTGLENIVTLNSYKCFLPDPRTWSAEKSKWNMKNDVINIPMSILDKDLPLFEENTCEVSADYYRLLAERQRESLADREIEYPRTQDLTLEDGKKVRVMLQKKVAKESTKTFEAIPEIRGAGWSSHPVVRSGAHSGFVPLLDERPMYIVDHGEKFYTHDAYGIHLGQEDRLTFLGAENLKARVTLLDCRENSPTLGKKISFDFSPDATRCLVIPQGVAHAFENLENIYTINQPRIFLTNELTYDSGNDVIDWPLSDPSFPKLKVNTIEAWREIYEQQARGQRRQMSRPPLHSTPLVRLVQNEDGRYVKVVLRKKNLNVA